MQAHGTPANAIHYPVLHLLDALLPADVPGHDFLMLTITLLTGLAFAMLFERPIGRFRTILRDILPAGTETGQIRNGVR